MKSKVLTLLASGALVLFVTGCATSKDALTNIENTANDANKNAAAALDTANKAMSAAEKAQGSADRAQSTADEALRKANEALDKSNRNEAAINELNEKIDRMFKKSMHK